MPSGSWNFTQRGAVTSHDDFFRGHSFERLPQSKKLEMKNNQGYYGAVPLTFPQATFSSCLYPTDPAQLRKPDQNNWHVPNVLANPEPYLKRIEEAKQARFKIDIPTVGAVQPREVPAPAPVALPSGATSYLQQSFPEPDRLQKMHRPSQRK